ncbi:MAG: hypothetical protein R2694_13950 [Ilumatobacteraceae bacterium]
MPAVTIHPRRLDTAPPPIGGVAGAVPGPLQPAGTETALTLASGDMISEIRATGVQVVPFDDHWCVIAHVSGVASFEPYLMNPGSIGVVADGVWNTSQAAGLCLPDDSPPEWQSILTPPGPPAGSRVPLTVRSSSRSGRMCRRSCCRPGDRTGVGPGGAGARRLAAAVAVVTDPRVSRSIWRTTTFVAPGRKTSCR